MREASEETMHRRSHPWRGGKMTVIPMRASCPSAECSALLHTACGRGRRTPFASATGAGSPKKRYTVSANICVAIVIKQPHSARRRCAPISLLTIAEILRASSRPGRCDENFCDGSFCGASFCRLALMFSFVHTTEQRSSQSSRFAIGRYTNRYTCIFICIRCCKRCYCALCHQVRGCLKFFSTISFL